MYTVMGALLLVEGVVEDALINNCLCWSSDIDGNAYLQSTVTFGADCREDAPTNVPSGILNAYFE